jgi:glutathione synthase/RimK-type ligase-like ATP-grasp enzyme
MVKKNESIVPKLIVLRLRSTVLDTEKRLNNTYLSTLCRDKLKSYEMFPEFVKKTLLLTSKNLPEIKNLHTDLVVVKPRYGMEGKNINIVKREDVTDAVLERFKDDEYIVQELIDSSSGIGNILKQRHELRIYIFNGRIQSGYLRVPAEGSYISNISLGAKEKMIDLQDVPDSAFNLIKKVDQQFTDIFPRMYCIDIMFENGKPWLVELNDTPGFPDLAVGQFTIDWHNALLDLFSESVN